MLAFSWPNGQRKGGSIYLITNKNNTTIYVGVTSDLRRRIIEHKEKKYLKSFSTRYSLNKLVYYEHFHSIVEAIGREKADQGRLSAEKSGID